MYAFVLKSHWVNFANNSQSPRNSNSITDTMEFLATVGTPCLLGDLNTARSQNNFNGADGYFVQISNGAAIKFNAALVADDLAAKISQVAIA